MPTYKNLAQQRAAEAVLRDLERHEEAERKARAEAERKRAEEERRARITAEIAKMPIPEEYGKDAEFAEMMRRFAAEQTEKLTREAAEQNASLERSRKRCYASMAAVMGWQGPKG